MQTLPANLDIPLLHWFSQLPPLEQPLLAPAVKSFTFLAIPEAVVSVICVPLVSFTLEPKLHYLVTLSISSLFSYSPSNSYPN